MPFPAVTLFVVAAIAVFAVEPPAPVGTHVIIENCRIHHLLSGTFKQQSDAHGITGHWGDGVNRITFVNGKATPG